jgi:hypothetical protein
MQLDAELPESLARRLRLDTSVPAAEPSETPRSEDSKNESRK